MCGSGRVRTKGRGAALGLGAPRGARAAVAEGSPAGGRGAQEDQRARLLRTAGMAAWVLGTDAALLLTFSLPCYRVLARTRTHAHLHTRPPTYTRTHAHAHAHRPARTLTAYPRRGNRSPAHRTAHLIMTFPPTPTPHHHRTTTTHSTPLTAANARAHSTTGGHPQRGRVSMGTDAAGGRDFPGTGEPAPTQLEARLAHEACPALTKAARGASSSTASKSTRGGLLWARRGCACCDS